MWMVDFGLGREVVASILARRAELEEGDNLFMNRHNSEGFGLNGVII